MSPPCGWTPKKATTWKVVALAMVVAVLLVHAAALVGAIVVLVREPKVVGWGLVAGFAAGLVLAHAFYTPWSALLEVGFWVGLWLGILGLGAYAARVFFGVSANVAFALFCGAIGLTFAAVICALSGAPADDYDD